MEKQDKAGHEQGDKQRKTGRPIHLDPDQGKEYRFKPGQSGNPAGRKKGTKNLSTYIQSMLNDPNFIDRLSEKVKDKLQLPDEEFQGIPAKAIITTAIIEAIDPNANPKARQSARDWLAKYGYGTKIDVTSGGERVEVAPLVISAIKPRDTDDAATPTETEAS